MPHLLFFDLETTGLIPTQHTISQFHAKVLKADTRQVVRELDLKVKFDLSKADPQALAINSYDAGVWEREGVSPTEARFKIMALFRAYADLSMTSKVGKSYNVAQLAGYNTEKFDMGFLKEFFEGAFIPVRLHSLDILQMALARECGNCVRFLDLKLKTVFIALLGKERADALNWHDAGADVEATIEIWKHLTDSGLA